MATFSNSQRSRVFHLLMILPAGVILLLLSLISLSTMAVTNRRAVDRYHEIRDQDFPNRGVPDIACILYAESYGTSTNAVVFSEESGRCNFSIVGGGILAVLAVAFTIVLVIKAVLGISM